MEQQREPGIFVPFGGAFELAAIAESLCGNGHSGWLGVRAHAEGPDWVELALPWKPELVADAQSEVLASGPIVTLMDNVSGVAVWKKRGLFLPQVTVDLRVDNMRPARPRHTVIGRGECYRLTRSCAFVRGVAYDDSPDDPIAHVVGTFMLIEDKP